MSSFLSSRTIPDGVALCVVYWKKRRNGITASRVIVRACCDMLQQFFKTLLDTAMHVVFVIIESVCVRACIARAFAFFTLFNT